MVEPTEFGAGAGFGRPKSSIAPRNRRSVPALTCATRYFGLEAAPPMYIPTKTPRKLDRKRSKLLRSKFKAKNRGRRAGLKK